MDVQQHPLYAEFLELWEDGENCFEGEKIIKEFGERYLPPTSGMRCDGYPTQNSIGLYAYNAYKMRAVFPDHYKEAVKIAVGTMHYKPANIELPDGMEELLEKATPLGESLQLLLRRINAEQLKTGRIGIFGDLRVNDDGKATPIILTYKPKTVPNWDDNASSEDSGTVSFVVLDESADVLDRQTLTWSNKKQYRVLALIDDTEGSPSFAEQGTYMFGVFEDGSFSAEKMEAPQRQGQALDKIPFVFINATDISARPDRPPLEGLANSCLTIYRSEADYRQSLFMQGQDTLVIKGGKAGTEDEPVRTGAGGVINVGANGDAKFIGVSSQGLGEQRQALENDYKRAGTTAGKLDTNGTGVESGEALSIRVAAQTATLPEIAMAGAEGLQKVLKILAEWLGFNPEQVVVKPNLEFVDRIGDATSLTAIMTARSLGAPISLESVHNWARENGFTDKTFDEEMALLQTEQPILSTSDDDRRQQGNSNGNTN